MAGGKSVPVPAGALQVNNGYTKGWQDLEGAKPDELEKVARQDAAHSTLREELSLITNAENLVVLAGSGTSLGITNRDDTGKVPPRMADLWAAVEKLPEFKKVASNLTPELVAAKNLEHVLSDAQARLALDTSNSDLAEFVRHAEDVVWERCSFIDGASDVDTHELFLRKVARRSTRLQRTQIFTTNYDQAFELAARRARFNIIDGFGYGGQDFDGASFDLDYVRRRPHEPLALEPSVFHLLKLHGSVDWNASKDGVQKILTGDKPADPVLIYPSTAKYQLSFQQPYLEFMSRFQIALRQPDVGLVVVGFGFNDDHLVAPIEAALRSNVGLRVVIVTPGIRGADRAPSLEWIEQLIDKGDRRITLLSGTFGDLVKLLPDVPAREDRDAHAERLSGGGR
jgi:hypothetical protein